MSRMSDLDLALVGLSDDLRVVPWSIPSLTIIVADDASLMRAVPSMWRCRVNRWLTVEYWCLPSSGFMGEEWT